MASYPTGFTLRIGATRVSPWRWWQSLGFVEQASLLLAGGVLFSPLGWVLLTFGGNLYIEPAALAVLGMLLVSRSPALAYLNFLLLRTKFVPVAALLMMLFLIGVAWSGDLVACYGDLRATLVLSAGFFLVATRNRRVRVNAIVAMFILNLLSVATSIVFYRYVWSDDVAVKNTYAFSSMIFIFCLMTRGTSVVWYAAALLVAGYICITGFYRQYYLYTALAAVDFIVFALASLLLAGRSVGRYALTFGALALALALLFPTVLTFTGGYLSADETRSVQSIEKFGNILTYIQTGELGGGDETRALYMTFIAANLPAFLLPSGLGSRLLIDNWGSRWSSARITIPDANSIDGGHLFLSAHFGLLIGLALSMCVVVLAVRAVWAERSMRAACSHLIYLFCTISFFSLTGAMFTTLNFAVSFGELVGLLCGPIGPVRLRRRTNRGLVVGAGIEGTSAPNLSGGLA